MAKATSMSSGLPANAKRHWRPWPATQMLAIGFSIFAVNDGASLPVAVGPTCDIGRVRGLEALSTLRITVNAVT
ncbi:hypothetical protein SPHV1_710017 [Novosphingobium sp. KN65.2]|nr:hypothetical protein SPHV1_710017 [Novosphingobium sp. KN65.2]